MVDREYTRAEPQWRFRQYCDSIAQQNLPAHTV